MADHKQAIIYIIRAANKKTFPEIHREVRAAQVEKVEKAWKGLEVSPLLQLLPMNLQEGDLLCQLEPLRGDVGCEVGDTAGVAPLVVVPGQHL